MRPAFSLTLPSLAGLILAVGGTIVTAACFETAPIGEQLCSGTNPGCCVEYCGDKAPEASCTDGAWTCPTNFSVGPVCDAVCKEGDGGTPVCAGDNPGCCSADCSVAPPSATCTSSGWSCPSGDTLGPACPAICETDGGPPTGCSGENPGCCTTDCSVTAPKATCDGSTWTCPAGDTVGPACPTICLSDAGPPTIECKGENPGCCTTDCSVKAPEATCNGGTWTCPKGDTLGPGCVTICEVDGGPPSTCEGANPGCCSSDCSVPPPEATCKGTTWTCPAGDSLGPACPDNCQVDGGPPSADAGAGTAVEHCYASCVVSCSGDAVCLDQCEAACQVDGGPPTGG